MEKKRIICGVGKIQNDFEYIFPHIKPDYYIETPNSQIYDSSMDICSFDVLDNEIDEVEIIICDDNKEYCVNKLAEYGYIYGIHVKYADDFFESLDYPIISKMGKRKLAIWGTTSSKEIVMKHLSAGSNQLLNRLSYFIDNDKTKKGTVIDGVEVISGEEYDIWKKCFIIVASSAYSEIKEQLEAIGLIETEDFINYVKAIRPSEMLKKTIYDKPLKGVECMWPFEKINIQPYGCYLCDWPSWLTTPVGNIFTDKPNDIWNSNVSRVIRLSMLNHTFSFCESDVCPYLSLEKEYDEDYIFDIKQIQDCSIPQIPTDISLSYDNSCNLQCLSCRQNKILCHSPYAEKEMDNVDKKIKESGWLNKASIIKVAGNGEVFFSKHYRNIVLESPVQRNNIVIQTNGTTINEKDIQKLTNTYKHVEFYISIDASTPETFKKLRTGSWDRLTQGLDILSKYRKLNKIKRIRLSFVIQKDNYKEIIDFIKMAKRYGFDWIYFSRLQNFPKWPEEIFWEKSMILPNGKMREELIEVFKEPLIQDDIVDIRQFYRNIDISGIGNLFQNRKETVFWSEID